VLLVAVAGALALLTHERNKVYHSEIAMWRDVTLKRPRNPRAHFYLALALSQGGDLDGEIRHYRRALDLAPSYHKARCNLALALSDKGDYRRAIPHYRKALETEGRDYDLHVGAAVALARTGSLDGAIFHYDRAAGIRPGSTEARLGLGVVLMMRGRRAAAEQQLRAALQLSPCHVAALRMLAFLLAASPEDAVRNGGEALRLAERARAIGGPTPEILDALAAAQAEVGRFDAATATLSEAIALAEREGKAALAREYRSRLDLYRGGRPFRLRR
jgi:Flp pilus assembly protein TadD